MIVPHTILGLLNKFSEQKLKKFEASSHAEYDTT